MWDKIITSSGINGYIATRDVNANEDWTEIIMNVTDPANINGSGFKASGTNIICQSNITVSNIKAVAKDVVIKKVQQ